MFHTKKILAWRIRTAVMSVVALAAWHAQAAVLPLSGDPTGGGAGTRAGLLDGPMSTVSGQWVGHTSSGRVVSLVVRISEGAVVGDATLDGVVADDSKGPRPLVTPTVTGRTLAFGVLPTPCAKFLARGVVTFVSQESAQLDLHDGGRPISVRLWKVS
jgi:hypothetical protein